MSIVDRILFEVNFNSKDKNLGIDPKEIARAKQQYFKKWVKQYGYKHLSHSFNSKNLESIKQNGLTQTCNFFDWGDADEDEVYGGFDAYAAIINFNDFKDVIYPDPEAITYNYNHLFPHDGKKLGDGEWGITRWLSSGLNLDLLFYFYVIEGGVSWIVIPEHVPPNKITIKKVDRGGMSEEDYNKYTS